MRSACPEEIVARIDPNLEFYSELRTTNRNYLFLVGYNHNTAVLKTPIDPTIVPDSLNEHRALMRLAGIPGIPRPCRFYNSYPGFDPTRPTAMVREYVDAEPLNHLDRRHYPKLFMLCRQMHARGAVLPSDLFFNLLDYRGQPYLIDAEYATLYEQGMPIKRRLTDFKTLLRAWHRAGKIG